MNNADTGYRMCLARVFEKTLRTYGWTDVTDRQPTDRPSYRDAAKVHLKSIVE